MTRDGEILRAFFDGTADAILVVDDAGHVVMANGACASLLGHRAEALCGQRVEAIVPVRFPEHPRHRADYTANPRARPMGRGLELFARHADGSEIPVDVSLTPLAVAGRRLVAATLRDLRGLSQGPESLRVQATALRSAANGVVITDRTGTITWVNPAACRITGYTAEELVGRHTRLLKSGQHDEVFYAGLWRTVMRGETWSGTIVNRRKDGSLYHEEQTIAPVVDESGGVSHFIAIKQDVSEQRRTQQALARANEQLATHVAEIEALNDRLREQALRDPLTGLYNRRYLEETVARDLARITRSGEPLAVAVVDVDHFKRVNDSLGHAAGDRLLQRLAGVLRSHVRASDLVCRLGGDEFVVVLPGASERVALARAERWRLAIAAGPLSAPDGVEIRVTLSIGIALHLEQEESLEESLRRADSALYQAKDAGRNCVVCAAQTPPATGERPSR